MQQCCTRVLCVKPVRTEDGTAQRSLSEKTRHGDGCGCGIQAEGERDALVLVFLSPCCPAEYQGQENCKTFY